MTDDELMKKAIRQENAKARLLLCVSEIVAELVADNDKMPSAMLKRLREMIEELKASGRS